VDSAEIEDNSMKVFLQSKQGVNCLKSIEDSSEVVILIKYLNGKLLRPDKIEVAEEVKLVRNINCFVSDLMKLVELFQKTLTL